MIATTERVDHNPTAWESTVQTDVSCPECGRHIAKSRRPPGLSTQTVWARAYCLRCHKWRWYDVVTGLPPEHHAEHRRMVG